MPKALCNHLKLLTGISQRDYTQYYDHISKQHEEICRSIQEFFKKHIQYKFLDEDCKYLKPSINKGATGRGRKMFIKVFKYLLHIELQRLKNRNEGSVSLGFFCRVQGGLKSKGLAGQTPQKRAVSSCPSLGHVCSLHSTPSCSVLNAALLLEIQLLKQVFLNQKNGIPNILSLWLYPSLHSFCSQRACLVGCFWLGRVLLLLWLEHAEQCSFWIIIKLGAKKHWRNRLELFRKTQQMKFLRLFPLLLVFN